MSRSLRPFLSSRGHQSGLAAVLQPVAFATDVDCRGVMQQPVQDRRGDDRIAKNRSPVSVALVRGQNDAPAFVPVIAAIVAICIIGAGALGTGSKSVRITAAYLFVSLLPWITAGVFLANGMLDRSDEVPHETTVVSVHYYLTSWDIITVRSWRSDRNTETFLWGTYRYTGSLYPGTSLTLGVKSGALGVSWMSSMSHHYPKAELGNFKLSPTDLAAKYPESSLRSNLD